MTNSLNTDQRSFSARETIMAILLGVSAAGYGIWILIWRTYSNE